MPSGRRVNLFLIADMIWLLIFMGTSSWSLPDFLDQLCYQSFYEHTYNYEISYIP